MPNTNIPTRREFAAWSVGGITATVHLLSRASATADDARAKPHETVSYFESGAIPVLKLIIPEKKQDQLREEPREYVRCTLEEDRKTVYTSIGVKLKGAAGSYRDFDDTPGLTLNLDKYKKTQRFHGMKKFHLNNCSQDSTFFSEWIGSELFRAAGYPAPRVGHARVFINDRDLGLYVLREGFDEPFRKRELGDARGNLYDGGFLQDVDTSLELDAGPTPEDRSDLVGLAIACSQEDATVRWQGISERIDLDRFLTFVAMERLCGHWDGYSLNKNNYRLYFPPRSRGVFLPHGMDQLFGDPNAGLYDHAAPLLAAAVMQNDAWRGQYQERLKKLLSLFRPANRWHARLDEMRQRLEPVLKLMDAEKAKAHRNEVQGLKDRLAQRSKSLEEQIKMGPPQPVKFDATGNLTLSDWGPAPDGEDAKLEEVELEGVRCYKISHKNFGDHGSSWRRRVLLPRGQYRIEVRLKTKDVVPIPDDQGRGAGLRQAGNGRAEGFAGTTNWEKMSSTIRVTEDQRETEWVLELRARHGTAWFDRSSLRIRRIG